MQHSQLSSFTFSLVDWINYRFLILDSFHQNLNLWNRGTEKNVTSLKANNLREEKE